MTRFEIAVQLLEAAPAPADRDAGKDRAAEPAGALARPHSAPAPSAGLFSPRGPATPPAAGGSPAHHRSSTRSAELWVQITLCVVVILLLLAVAALPKRVDSRARSTSHRAAHELHIELQKLRGAVSDYRFDHGSWPGLTVGAPRDTAAVETRARLLERQLAEHSDVAGRTSAEPHPGFPLGPYLDGQVPENPIDGLASVRVLGEDEDWPELPDDSTGWIYQPRTGEVRANCRGFVPGSSLCFYDL